jgi:class 3 adenylate cyclase
MNERARDAVARFERACASPSGVLALLKMTSNLDTRPLLPLVRVPTLVIHRQSDPVITADGSRHLAENIPGARLWQQPGEHLIGTGDVDALADEVEEFLTGVRPAPEPDRVLATVLFTDLVGSTRLAAELGDRAWRERLDHHDELCRHEVERHRGRYVKATGDGLLATFDGPARAIRCALTIVRGVRALGLDARAGLHTGEVELRGDDVGGIAVHIAARVMQPARPGEVFVSQAVPLLVAGSGIKFEERGEHELKGVPGRWGLFAVVRE